MSEENTTAVAPDQGGASPSADPVSAKPTTIDNLASLLSEYEAATARPTEKASPGEATPAPAANVPAPVPQSPENNSDPGEAAFNRDMKLLANEQELKNIKGFMEVLYQDRQLQQARADFSNIVTRGEKALKEAGVPVSEEFVQRWLISEAQTNPQLRDAFDKRYASPENQRRAEKLIKQSMQNLVTSARREPDPDATADRNAVAAAVRGASTNKIQERPAPRYGDMTDGDFAAEKKRLGL